MFYAQSTSAVYIRAKQQKKKEAKNRTDKKELRQRKVKNQPVTITVTGRQNRQCETEGRWPSVRRPGKKQIHVNPKENPLSPTMDSLDCSTLTSPASTDTSKVTHNDTGT